jgi:hypothetical protein
MGSAEQQTIDDRLYEKWKQWIERIYDETVALFAYRSFYRGLAEITEANEEIPPTSFFDALGAWYATTQAMAVRRQTDTGADAVSLAKLLVNMGVHPHVMNRDRFLSLWGDEEHWQMRGSEQFDKYVGDGGDQIAKEYYEADLERFQRTAQPIKDYVDRLVAHNDQRELSRLPTWAELNDAIDLLEEMLNKYMVLLKATSVPSADPVHQEDWKAAFRVPWLRERVNPRRRRDGR